MALILDTNALSRFAEGDDALRASLEQQMDLAIPCVVLAEYLFGVRRSKYRRQYEAWLAANLDLFQLLATGRRTAGHYADVRAELKAAGRPIPSNDVWIAAICREHGGTLVTRDGHFQAVAGLRTLAW